MDTEIEAMFAGADFVKLRNKLADIGAKLVHAEYDSSRITFDYDDLRLDADASWIRLRHEAGGKVTLAYKKREAETIDGMKEVEVEVSDFNKTKEFMLSIGLAIKSEQQSRREIWKCNGVQIMLDTWPWIPPIVEIEGESEAAVRTVSDELRFDWSVAYFDSIDAVYMDHFDVTRTEICTIPLRFGPVPQSLESKRRNKE